MIAKYQIFKEVNLEVLKFYGPWDSGDFEKYLQKISLDDDRQYIERVLVDLREVDLNLVRNSRNEIIRLREKYVRKKYNIVHLVDNPTGTAQSHLYQESLKEKGNKYSYCSTIECAIRLLELNYTKAELKSIIKNFDNLVK